MVNVQNCGKWGLFISSQVNHVPAWHLVFLCTHIWRWQKGRLPTSISVSPFSLARPNNKDTGMYISWHEQTNTTAELDVWRGKSAPRGTNGAGRRTVKRWHSWNQCMSLHRYWSDIFTPLVTSVGMCSNRDHKMGWSTATSSGRGQKKEVWRNMLKLVMRSTARQLLYFLICFVRKSKSCARMLTKTDVASVMMQIATEEVKKSRI